MISQREPDAGNPHVRFAERRLETGPYATAPVVDSTQGGRHNERYHFNSKPYRKFGRFPEMTVCPIRFCTASGFIFRPCSTSMCYTAPGLLSNGRSRTSMCYTAPGLLSNGRSRTSMCYTAPGLLSNGKSLSSHSYRYDLSNDFPNCFASYSTNSGSLMKCSG